MSGSTVLLLMFAGALLLFVAVAFLVGNRPSPGKPGPAPADDALLRRQARNGKLARAAFWYSALALAAHRAGFTWLLLGMDFSDSATAAGFGMSWWFLDPLAGFPIILGTAVFSKELPMPQFMSSVYIPLSLLLSVFYVYCLWRLARHAFMPPARQPAAAQPPQGVAAAPR